VAADGEGEQRPDTATLVAFTAAVIVAGGNAPAIRYVACRSCELDPLWAAAQRFLLASALLAIIAVVVRAPLPRSRGLIGAITFGVLQFGAGFGLIYQGLVRTPAGLGQVLIALVPLLTFGLALAHRQERFRWEGLVGAICSLTGSAVVFNSGLDTGVPFSSMALIVAGAVCWAEALVAVKAFPRVHPVSLNTVAMAVGGVMLCVTSIISGETWAIPDSADTWLAQAYLIIPGSIGVFLLYVFVLRAWTASAASYQLVLIPLVTVPVSAWLQDERITWSFAVGTVLVLGGVYVGALKRPGNRDRRRS
jgi:drug/metabolite transporter (DMT)-like permease